MTTHPLIAQAIHVSIVGHKCVKTLHSISCLPQLLSNCSHIFIDFLRVYHKSWQMSSIVCFDCSLGSALRVSSHSTHVSIIGHNVFIDPLLWLHLCVNWCPNVIQFIPLYDYYKSLIAFLNICADLLTDLKTCLSIISWLTITPQISLFDGQCLHWCHHLMSIQLPLPLQ